MINDYLPNEACGMPQCSEIALVQGYCGRHWNKRTVHRINRATEDYRKLAEQLYVRLLASHRFRLIR